MKYLIYKVFILFLGIQILSFSLEEFIENFGFMYASKLLPFHICKSTLD